MEEANALVVVTAKSEKGDDEFRLLVDTTLVRLYRSQAIGRIYELNFGKAQMSDLLRAMYTLNALPN